MAPGTHNNTGQPKNKIYINKYIDNIVLFGLKINQNILKNSNFKYFDTIKSSYVLRSLKFKLPNCKFINPTKNTCEVSNSFKLTIEVDNSTGFLESLNLNIPVILIYDEKYCSLRESVIKDFEILKKVKIMHDSPEEAAKFVNENYDHLEKWWNSKLLQSAKNKFCYKFARQSNSPLKDLKRALSDGK